MSKFEFMCWGCRRFKKIELLGKVKKNGKKVCLGCLDKIKPPIHERAQ